MQKQPNGEVNALNDAAAIAAVEAENSRIQTLKPDEVRALWRNTFKKEVPKALTRDLLVRTLCWRIQERAFGGHSPAILKSLANYAKGGPSDGRKLRRLKPGTEVVREYQGERHTVVITADGFRWQDKEYASLSAMPGALPDRTGMDPASLACEREVITNCHQPHRLEWRTGLRPARVPGRKVGPDEYAPQTFPLCHLHSQIDRT
jgi:hypothetical protein